MFVPAVLIFFLTFLIIVLYKTSFSYWKKRKVAFPEPTFPWGNCESFFTKKTHFGEHVEKFYKEMKKRKQRFFGIYIFTKPCLVPIDPEIVKSVLSKDFNSFQNRSMYYNEKHDPISAHLLSLNGEKWRKLRTKVTPTFSSGKIKTMYNVFLECTKILDDIFTRFAESGEEFEIQNVFQHFTTEIIGNCAFGLDLNLEKSVKLEFLKNARLTLEYRGIRGLLLMVVTAFPNLCHFLGFKIVESSASRYFTRLVRDTVEKREKSARSRKDFLQLLIDLKNNKSSDESLTMDELIAQCFIFILAGYETSSTTMAFSLYEITKNGDIYEKVMREIEGVLQKYNNKLTYDALNEMKYLGQVVDEALRKYSPAFFVTRVCTKNYKIEGSDYEIEKGTTVIIPIKALHYDPEFYPDPDRFNPERFSEENRASLPQFAYLPFGGGPRHCIGLRFGHLEAKLAVAFALTKFQFSVNSRTAEPIAFDPEMFILSAKGGLWMNCERKSSC